MKTATLATALLACAFISNNAIAQSKAAIVGQCVKDRLSNIQVQSRKSISRDIAAHCEPGHNEVFKGCVGSETQDTSTPLTSSPGYRLVLGSGSVERTGGDTPNRTGVQLISQNADQVIGRAYCYGHGCGGEGAVQVYGQIRALEERVLTDSDSNEALDYCLNKLIQ